MIPAKNFARGYAASPCTVTVLLFVGVKKICVVNVPGDAGFIVCLPVDTSLTVHISHLINKCL
jgi:hypothetical protein